MANTGIKGVDVRQSGAKLVFWADLKDTAGVIVSTGTTTIEIVELQDDGSVKTYDFNDNTFKATAVVTQTLALTHRPSNNATIATGLWTAVLSTLTGFTANAMYETIVRNAGASPPQQPRIFQFGGDQGDQVVQTGDSYIRLGAPVLASISADIASRMATFAVPTNFGSLVINGAGTVESNLVRILGTLMGESGTGLLAGGFRKLLDVSFPNFTIASFNQGGDTYARLGAPSGATVSADILVLLTRFSAARAGYLDNLNVGGPVASHSDVIAINTSSSKHIIMTTVGQYERPESGSTVYTVEARTFSAADGSAVNADTTPTLTATGQTSGSLASANLSAATNPATGVYRWTYTVLSTATNEPIRFDVSATIAASVFTLACFTQVLDEVSVTFSQTDKDHLTTIFNKLPANAIADETLVMARLGVPVGADLSHDIAATLQANAYQAPDNENIAAILTDTGSIKAKTSLLNFDNGGVRLPNPAQSGYGGGGGSGPGDGPFDANVISVNGVAVVGPLSITYGGPVSDTGEITIVRGSAYKSIYSNAIVLSVLTSALPSLAGATVVLRDVGKGVGSTPLSTATKAVVGSNTLFTFQLEDEATGAMAIYDRDYAVWAEYGGVPDDVILAAGVLTVKDP